ncbi:MAG: hypothetical protein K5839_04105 [Treponemataceae bacterium]|nr:hypothetical protein [Treponemataceae bacterium]
MKCLKIITLVFYSLTLLILTSCACKSDVDFVFGKQSQKLLVSDKNSKAGTIPSENGGQLNFIFPANIQKKLSKNERPYALEISFRSRIGFSQDFSYCFTYKNDKNKVYYVKGFLNPKISENGNYAVSMIIPALEKGNRITGFSFSTTSVGQVLQAKITEARIGWSFIKERPWFAFSEKGGQIESLEKLQNTSLKINSCYIDTEKNNYRIYFSLNNLIEDGGDYNSNKVRVNIADRRFAFNSDIKVRNQIVNTSIFSKEIDSIDLISNSSFVDAIIFDINSADSLKPQESGKIKPLMTDTGLISNWPVERWRNPQFELYEWYDFPGILIFDFADYQIQDAFLKRLAFFVEKTGSIGTLLTDSQMRNLHGYNAHDYKAQSLAEFFQAAKDTNFPLNESEELLKEILINNKIIILEDDGNFKSGNGALISISQQSPEYLRDRFLVHEGMHGVYFITESYRKFISELYAQTDPKSIEFLKAYFTVTPSLNYNIEDQYLLENEFMGYLVQQRLSDVADYFGRNLPTRKFVRQNKQELSQYMIDTKAQGFVEAGEKLDSYLFKRWGFNLGRTWKASSVSNLPVSE